MKADQARELANRTVAAKEDTVEKFYKAALALATRSIVSEASQGRYCLKIGVQSLRSMEGFEDMSLLHCERAMRIVAEILSGPAYGYSTKVCAGFFQIYLEVRW